MFICTYTRFSAQRVQQVIVVTVTYCWRLILVISLENSGVSEFSNLITYLSQEIKQPQAG